MEYVKQGDGIGALGRIFVLGTGVILSDVLVSNMLYKVNGIVLRHMKKMSAPLDGQQVETYVILPLLSFSLLTSHRSFKKVPVFFIGKNIPYNELKRFLYKGTGNPPGMENFTHKVSTWHWYVPLQVKY